MAYSLLYFFNCKISGIISSIPIINSVAAVSCGICDGQILLDLDYSEDSSAEADANFILTGDNKIVEIRMLGSCEPGLDYASTFVLSNREHIDKVSNGDASIANVSKYQGQTCTREFLKVSSPDVCAIVSHTTEATARMA